MKKDGWRSRRTAILVNALFIAAILAVGWKIADHLIQARRSADFARSLGRQAGAAYLPGETAAPAEADDGRESDSQTLPADGSDAPESIDFDALWATSGDAVAWLYCPGTGLNDVVAQGRDNAYYLHRLLDGTPNTAGTLFIDCRNSRDFTDYNTIIYGHNMKNGSMFGRLDEYRNPEYCAAHPVMYLYLPGERLRLELVAALGTVDGSEFYDVPDAPQARDALLAKALEKSTYNFGVDVSGNDRLVTLSTCAYNFDDGRFIVVARIADS